MTILIERPLSRLLAWLGLLWWVELMSACGTPWSPVSDAAGRPVMLLAHDPVAYFNRGVPQPGTAQHVVDLPERSYYFANAKNRALFLAAPARYEPQYGGFCASGAAFAVLGLEMLGFQSPPRIHG